MKSTGEDALFKLKTRGQVLPGYHLAPKDACSLLPYLFIPLPITETVTKSDRQLYLTTQPNLTNIDPPNTNREFASKN